MPSSPNGSPADNAESNKALLEEIARLIQSDNHQGSMEDERSALVTGLNQYQPGTPIGHFKIVRRLGEGGFAEVFEATQEEPVRRRVALKVMKTGNLSLEGIARFEVERQALAMMEHPNIATVHEAGTTPFGQPYFAMEYVEGTSITDFCREQQLSVQDKIKLLIQVSLAIHHAHQKGIIHRDLKPSNVLVFESDGKPHPKVIDFGVAKVIESQLDNASLTKEHQILGTLAYMSPEQLEGQLDQIDTRTDVHALGILAYELLTGRTPYELENEPSALSYPKALEYARHHEPQSPSSRMPSGQRSQLKGDLDWIVMKALAKEKGRRYDSSSDFANDLARHLRHEPVDAAAPSFFYRARKGARRHAVILGTLGAVCLSLIVGAFMSLKQSRRAETNLATAQAVSAFLGKDLLAIGTGELDKAHYLSDLSFRNGVDKASRRVETEFQDQPTIAVPIHVTLASVYLRLSSPDLAQKQLDQAKAIGEAFPWFEPKFAGDCVKIQAEISMRSAQYPKALSQFELLCERTDISPQDRVYAMKRIVRCLLKLKRLEEAEQRCHQFLSLASGPIANAEITYALADVYSEQGRHADCVETIEKATRLYQVEGLTPDRSFVETSLGGLYGSLGMFSENRDPHVVDYLCGKKSAALLSLRAGQTEEARQLASFVFETSEERWGPNHLATLALCILGACSEINGNLSNAEEFRLQARSRLDSLKFHPVNTIETLRQLGYHYFRTGQYHKAEAVFQDALQRNPREQIFAHDLERAMALSIHQPLLSIGEAAEVHWKVTAEQPSSDWTLPEYDDDSWTSKRAPLGNTHWDPYRLAHSEWRSSNIWLRTHLMLDTLPKDSVSLHLAHRGSVSVYINGRHACSPEQTHLGAYQFVEISPQAKAALRPGANVIAVRCNATNSPFFDLGIYEESPALNERAIDAFAKILKSDSTQEHLWQRYAYWLSRAGRWDEAFDSVKSLLIQTPNLDLKMFADAPSEWVGRVRDFQRERRDRQEDALADASWDPARVQTIVARGDIWHYDDHGQDLGNAWQHTLQADWPKGEAPLGYGEPDAMTLLDDGDQAPSRRPSAFFQHRFEASKIDHLEKLKLRLRFDDGVAVYLNGTEIARANLDPSPTYNSYSTDKVSGIDETRYQVFIVDDSLLVEGTNLLSAQVHQDSPTSSDIIFDLALEALLQ